MRIHCVCVVRDEADILSHTLDAALHWAHAIYVCDHSSTDGTWELLQDFARRDPRLVLVGQHSGAFRDSLRGEIVNQVAGDARPGDWWCRLDGDEVYVDHPPRFLSRIEPDRGVVYSASIEYFFTDRDLAAYQDDPEAYLQSWRPEWLRYYLASWSEARFVRHQRGVMWTDAWPEGFWDLSGAPQRIRLRHYQYRSPPQIQRRLQARLDTAEDGLFSHEKVVDWTPTGNPADIHRSPDGTDRELWQSRVVRASALHLDDGSGNYQIDWGVMPTIHNVRRTARRSLLQRMIQRMGWT